MEDKCYMGIDVGDKGFIVTQYKGDFKYYSIIEHDLYELADFMRQIRQDFSNLVCVIEDVHAITGSSAKGTFGFGFNKGYLIGLLSATKIPYQLVQPKVWQKEMWENSDMVITYKKVKIKDKEVTRKSIDTKKTSINCAKRLFPNTDFRRTQKCKNIDDNKVDATLMCEYARRKNL